MRKFLNELVPHLRAIFSTVMYTGIRSKELKFIRPEQVSFEDSYIQLRAGETKNSEPRKVGINERVKRELIEWAKYTNEHHPETKWFFHYEGNQIGDCKPAWYAALVRAGLRTKDENGKWVNEVRFHDTRRHAATFNSEAGVSRSDNQQSLGHVSESVNLDYDQSDVVKRTLEKQNAHLKRTW